MSEENKALIRNFVQQAQSSGLQASMAAVDATMAPDFVNHTPMGLSPDREGVKTFFTMLWTGLPDLTATIHDQIAERDLVVTRKTLSGTHQGDFMGVPATGKRINIEVIDILQVRDGKIVSHRALVDQVGMMQQLGAMPA